MPPTPTPTPTPIINKEAQAPLPDWLPAEPWAGYVEMRKKIRKPMTPRAQKLVLASLAGMLEKGIDIEQALNNSTRNSWIDVYEPKAKPSTSEPKFGSDEYFEVHRHQRWWADAGFDSVWEAANHRCHHKNAHEFRDGKKLQVAA
jgi:hypothetical protein